MFGIIALILVFITFILCVKDNTYGLIIFLVTRILIPETVRLPGGIISLNTAVIMVLLSFTVLRIIKRNGRVKFNIGFIFAVCIFLIYSVIALIISDYGNISTQFNSLIKFFITDLLPPLLFVINIKKFSQVKKIIKAFVIISIICCSYGIISTLIGKNYYLLYVNQVFGADVYIRNTNSWFGSETAGTFVSTNSFGYYISLSIPFLMYIRSKSISVKESNIAIGLLCVCAILCKKRTTFLVVLLYFLILFLSGDFKKRIKIVFLSL